MEIGFIIQCLKCGHKEIVKPGKRNRESEKITFGADVYDVTYISCRCGNVLEDNYYYEEENGGCEFIEEWRVLPQ